MFRECIVRQFTACTANFFAVLFLLSVSCTAQAQKTSNEWQHINTTQYQQILKQTNQEYLWFDEYGLTLSGLTLHDLLADLGGHNIGSVLAISKTHYRQHDRMLTQGFLALINLDSGNNGANKQGALITAIKTNSTDKLLQSLIPEYEQVTLLREAISYYRHLSAYPWPILDFHFKPKLGQSHPQVKGIREILVHLRDMSPNAQSPSRLNVYDAVVIAALKKFQHRHGLRVDGQLGANTYAALQVPPEQRIEQLQINLWRWFKLPKQPPEKYVVVNIPSYQLSLIEQEKPILQMKVIVGDSENPTPQMITELGSLTINPTWTPTVNIIKNELIPDYQKDYLSLKRRNFQLRKGSKHNYQSKEIDQPNLNLPLLLQSYRLVQASGENNALGYYRFNIVNRHAIYLHDTPVKSLFRLPKRALSHGCIRLEKPNLLANYVLQYQEKTQRAMTSALNSGDTTNLYFTHALPVYITYQTAWFTKQGELRWAVDIYALDNINNLAQFKTTISNPVITLSANHR